MHKVVRKKELNPEICLVEFELNKRGNIVAEENGQISVEDICAGGDIVTGSATVIAAMGVGKQAAKAMDAYLSRKKG